MALSEQIQQRVQRLPISFQVEVLSFVEYLVVKAEQEMAQREKKSWSDLSLAFAMRGMEDSDTSLYSFSDLKVVF